MTEPEWQAALAHFGVQQTLSHSNVSSGPLTQARRAAGVTLDGHHFFYIRETDELLRYDVFKWVLRRRADAVVAQRDADAAAQGPQA